MSRYSGEYFRCGHPKTPENSAHRAGNAPTCRTCKQAREKKWRAENEEKFKAQSKEAMDRYRKRLKESGGKPATKTSKVEVSPEVREKSRLANAKYREQNRERERERAKDYYWANREKVLAKSRELRNAQ